MQKFFFLLLRQSFPETLASSVFCMEFVCCSCCHAQDSCGLHTTQGLPDDWTEPHVYCGRGETRDDCCLVSGLIRPFTCVDEFSPRVCMVRLGLRVFFFSLGPMFWQMRREAIAAAPASSGGENANASAGEGQVGKPLPDVLLLSNCCVGSMLKHNEPFRFGVFSIANKRGRRETQRYPYVHSMNWCVRCPRNNTKSCLRESNT